MNPGRFTAKHFPSRGVGGILWAAVWDFRGLGYTLEDLSETRLGNLEAFATVLDMWQGAGEGSSLGVNRCNLPDHHPP